MAVLSEAVAACVTTFYTPATPARADSTSSSSPSRSPPPANPDDILAGFDAVPLFMKSLPEELGGTAKQRDIKEGETNPSDTLAALQALAYDGDPSGASSRPLPVPLPLASQS